MLNTFTQNQLTDLNNSLSTNITSTQVDQIMLEAETLRRARSNFDNLLTFDEWLATNGADATRRTAVQAAAYALYDAFADFETPPFNRPA